MVSQAGRVWAFLTVVPGARSVSVVGEFNGWNPEAAPMKRVGPDRWLGLFELEPGEYRFRYLADEHRWLTDFAAFGVELNEFGQWDSVLYVPEAPKIDRRSRGKSAAGNRVSRPHVPQPRRKPVLIEA